MSCTIRVLSTSGAARGGVRVAVSFTGLTRGLTSAKYTDKEGRVEFECSGGEATIFVEGKDRGRHHCFNGREITIRC